MESQSWLRISSVAFFVMFIVGLTTLAAPQSVAQLTPTGGPKAITGVDTEAMTAGMTAAQQTLDAFAQEVSLASCPDVPRLTQELAKDNAAAQAAIDAYNTQRQNTMYQWNSGGDVNEGARQRVREIGEPSWDPGDPHFWQGPDAIVKELQSSMAAARAALSALALSCQPQTVPTSGPPPPQNPTPPPTPPMQLPPPPAFMQVSVPPMPVLCTEADRNAYLTLVNKLAWQLQPAVQDWAEYLSTLTGMMNQATTDAQQAYLQAAIATAQAQFNQELAMHQALDDAYAAARKAKLADCPTTVPVAPGPPPQPKPPVPPPPLPPDHGMAPAPTTGGLYAGLTLGGATGRSNYIEPVDPSFGLSGPIGGAELGYEWRPYRQWRLGLEGDVSGSGISGKTTQNCGVGCGTSNDWVMTFRGKVGYDFDPLVLYGTGGLAVGDVNANVGGFPGNSKTRGGWAAGAGLSLPLSSLSSSLPAGWMGKLEWLHVDLGSSQLCTPPTCGGTATIPFSADVIRLGIDIPLTSLFGDTTAADTGPAVATALSSAPSPRAQQGASLAPLPATDFKKDVDAGIKSRQGDGGVQRFTIRFDDRLAALTPGGIRALDDAVAAIKAGQRIEIEIEIDGCGSGADHSDGSACARRAVSLKQLLAQRGVPHANRPLADAR